MEETKMEALERLVNGAGANAASRTIDIYTGGAVELYTGPMHFDLPKIEPMRFTEIRPIEPLIKPGYGMTVLPYGNLTGLGGETHDSFKLDRYGNPYDGHTTIKIPGYDKFTTDW